MEPLGQRPPDPGLAGWPEADRRRLDALFDALAFPTPTSFRLADEPAIEVVTPPGEGSDGPLVEALWPFLYQRCYARTFDAKGGGDSEPYARDPEFAAGVSAAHATRAGWDPAWRVCQVGSDGSVRVRKGDRFREVRPGQYAFAADPSRPPRVDEPVDLLVCRESFIAQPGFYYAYGEALGCDFDDADQVRIYFHSPAEGVPRLLGGVGGALNRFGVPFFFKCRDDPGQSDLADSSLLIVSSRFLAITLRLLEDLDGLLDGLLEPATPLFTRILRAGVGLADNPTDSASFGQGRCTLLAQGLVDARLAGDQGREARHRAVAGRFARAGLDPARPHLNPGSSDRHRRPDGGPWESEAGRLDPIAGPPESGTAGGDFLEAADRIGRRIGRDALWSGGRCNWMTWAAEDGPGRTTLVHRAAPPGLFVGVAGIALFLAHLWRATGDRQQAIALGGAVRQLLATTPRLTASCYPDGRLGVGHALVAIGGLLGDEALVGAGTAMMRPAPGSGAVPVPEREAWPSLSPFRALDGDRAEIAREVDDAVRSASRFLSSAESDDLSLGRGLSGHLDFLVEAAGPMGRPDLRILAERCGRAAIDRFHRTGLPWPCGVRGAGETPDLMTGTAGIGLTFLRLRNPGSVPSPLRPYRDR